MATLEQIKKAVASAEDLLSVVRTMKTIAAVSIHQFEGAVAALTAYHGAVEAGLQVLLRESGAPSEQSRRPRAPLPPGAIFFGSDQGMIGRFNEDIVAHGAGLLNEAFPRRPGRTPRIVAVGERLVPTLGEVDLPVERLYTLPATPAAIAVMIQKILMDIDAWRDAGTVEQVFVYYHRPLARMGYQAHHLRLMPPDEQWLTELATRPWPNHCLPLPLGDRERLFRALLGQYLFVSLHRACAESVAAENVARLTAMQAAEKNIEERLDGLNAVWRSERQRSITEELLDIVSGFEAMKESPTPTCDDEPADGGQPGADKPDAGPAVGD